MLVARRHVVAIDARRSGGSGIGRYTQCLVEAFRFSDALRGRFEVVELVSKDADLGPFRVRWGSPLLSPWRSNELECVLRSAGADVLIAPQYYVPPVAVVPVVRVLHDAHPFWPDFQSPERKVFERLYGVGSLRDLAEDVGLDAWGSDEGPRDVAALIQRMYKVGADEAAELVTVSEFSAAELSRFMPTTDGRWTVAYPFVAKSLSAAPFTPGEVGGPLLLSVSKLEPRKNQLALILAVEELRAEFPGMHLTLVGGPTASFPEYARVVRAAAAKTAGTVSLVEYVEDSGLSRLYKTCDLFVSASVSEGFGFPGLEALESGAKVLVGSESSMPEVYGRRAEYFNESGLREPRGTDGFQTAVLELRDAIRRTLLGVDTAVGSPGRPVPHEMGDGPRPTADSFGEVLDGVLERVL